MFLLLFLTPKEGGVWTFGFAKLANFWFGFRFSRLKSAVFRSWCLVRVFSNLVLVTMAVFGFFCPIHFKVFLVLPRKLHPIVTINL